MANNHSLQHQLLSQNRQLAAEIQQRVNQLAATNAVATTISQSLDLDATLETALDAVLGVINVEAAAISLLDEQAGQLVLRAQRGLTLDFVTDPLRIPLYQGLSGEAAREDRVVITGDPAADDRLAVPAFGAEHIQALALVPMHARGRVVGVLSVMSHTPYTFSEAEIDLLTAIADQIGVALDNARLYAETCRSDQHLHAIVNAVNDAIIAIDANEQVCWFNGMARQCFGLVDEAVLGQSLANMPLPAPVQRELRQALNARYATHRAEVMLDDEGSCMALTLSELQAGSAPTGPDTGPLPATPTHRELATDAEPGWVIVLQDISHLKRVEQTRRVFVQTAAHDLRNPLGIALSALVMLEELCGSDPSTADIARIGINSVNRMHDLLDDLLDLENLDTGLHLNRRLLEPLPLLENALREMTPLLQHKAQTWALDVPDYLPPLSVDRQWFQRALNNYLSNANKYTPQGGHITLRARLQDEQLFFEVEDTGPGIAPEAQRRLFERFYRVPEVQGTVKGTGLGLAIVKSVAEAHGGRVYANSTPGVGSIFGLALPLTGTAAVI